MIALRSRAIVTPSGIVDGYLAIAGDRIQCVGPAADAPPSAIDLGSRVVVPGFVDIHNHGGGGAWVTSSRTLDIRRAIDTHLAEGTTGIVVSLMSRPIDELVAQLHAVAVVASLDEYRERVLGVHLEGPFLSPERSGAQPKHHLSLPDTAKMRLLLDAAPWLVRMVTLAPELAGARQLIDMLRSEGVVVALGHSAASADEAAAAYERGAAVATHLWNGMAPIQSRAPGLAGASLANPRVVLELVADGVHVHETNIRIVLDLAGADRVALVTDAAAVAGLPVGEYDVRSSRIAVRDAAFDAETDELLGSTMTMSEAFRRAVREYGLDLVGASTCTSSTPARALGVRSDRGAIEAGMLADLVVLDSDSLAVEAVFASGDVVSGALPAH
ncbi:MAG: N-acetylglucosamine-6-phosphate deacetylase [Candidatus Microbacterium stercoravium]